MTPSRVRPLPFALLALLLTSPAPVHGRQADDLQREIQESRLRLEEIRGERAALQEEMAAIRVRVQDASEELENIERQINAQRSVLLEIDFQTEAAAQQVEITSRDLIRTRDRLSERQAILNRRLRDIYKRGSLQTAEVLLGAESFSDLLNRYHYLRLIASYDRTLIETVQELERELESQNEELRESLAELQRLRSAKSGEVAGLRQVESERARALEQFRSEEQAAVSALDRIDADEARITDVLVDLERRRVEEERRRSVAGLDAPGGSLLSPADAGALDWPADGPLLYPFGPQRRPDGTVLRWNGIGIGAPPGSPVRAVRGGTVSLAGPFEGYGPSVILSHGGGYYSLYLYLDEIGVIQDRTIEAGQVVGTVGGMETPQGPRVEFQLRVPIDGGTPQAIDPLPWLRPR